MSTPLTTRFTEIIEFIKKSAPFKVDMGLILGSGLGDFANNLKPEFSISTADIPNYPVSTVAGHSGKIHFVNYENKKLMIFQGRIHYYEGYRLEECLLPVELCYHLGAKSLIITNAAGGINADYVPGDLMLASGLNGMFIKKELAVLLSVGSVERKNNLTNLNDFDIANRIKSAALTEKIDLKVGSYFFSKGPSYETPAEIRFIRSTGGDAVGMSSVHEAIYGIDLGLEVGVISCITNFAAGITSAKLDHSEVTETANMVKHKFESLLRQTISIS